MKVATIPAAGATERGLAELMVGRQVLLEVERGAAHPGDAGARGRRPARASTTATSRPCAASRCTVRAGEIVGIAGVDGNGQTELAEAIAGMRQAAAGTITLDGRDITDAPRRAQRPRPASGTSRRTASATAWCSTSALAENSALHDYDRAADLAARLARPRGDARAREPPDRALRRARRRARDAGARALGRQPAEARAGARDRLRAAACCSPRSRRAASTSARSSSCTAS